MNLSSLIYTVFEFNCKVIDVSESLGSTGNLGLHFGNLIFILF